MLLIPYAHIEISTSLALGDAVQVLSDHVARRVWFEWFPKNPGQFEGVVSESGFNLNRVIAYRNSFLPYLYGHFEELPAGVRVDVTIVMHPLVILILLVFALYGVFYSGFSTGLLVISSMFYAVIMLSFNYEYAKAVKFLSGVYARHKARGTHL